jgi:hypothetical protein
MTVRPIGMIFYHCAARIRSHCQATSGVAPSATLGNWPSMLVPKGLPSKRRTHEQVYAFAKKGDRGRFVRSRLCTFARFFLIVGAPAVRVSCAAAVNRQYCRRAAYRFGTNRTCREARDRSRPRRLDTRRQACPWEARRPGDAPCSLGQGAADCACILNKPLSLDIDAHGRGSHAMTEECVPL